MGPVVATSSNIVTASMVNRFHRWQRKDEIVRDRPYRQPINAAVCKDGFIVSIQASLHSYCSPRVTEDTEYSEFELGFPSMRVPELTEWKDGEKVSDDSDMQSVYGYVPAEVVAGLLQKHGGLIGALTYFHPEEHGK